MAERLPDRAFLKQREAVTDARSSKDRVARQARRMPVSSFAGQSRSVYSANRGPGGVFNLT